MKKAIIIAFVSTLFIPVTTNAQVRERTVTGAAIGAGAGAIVAGPPGAVVGGVAGALIGGPRISPHRSEVCWRDRDGERHCRWR